MSDAPSPKSPGGESESETESRELTAHSPLENLLQIKTRTEVEISKLATQLTACITLKTGDSERIKIQKQLKHLNDELKLYNQSIKVLEESARLRYDREARTTSTAPRATPPRAKMPKNLPRFDTESKESPVHFLKKFELMLQAEEYPQAKWGQALAIHVKGSGAQWVMTHLANQENWQAAREAFLQHFDHPDQKHIKRQRLMNMKQKDTESVRKYSERFEALLEEIGEDDTSETILMVFYLGLKKKIKSRYRLAMHMGRSPTSLLEATTLAMVIEASKEERLDTESGVATSAKGAREAPKDNKSKAGSGGKPLPSPSTSSKESGNRPQLRCDICKLNNHATKDCWKKNTSTSMERNPTLQCYHCHEKGHIATYCPKLKSPQGKPMPDTTQLKKLRASQVEPQEDLDELFINDEEGYKLRVLSERVPSECKEIMIDLKVNGVAVKALVDTGCTNTTMDEDLAKELRLPLTPSPSKINLGGRHSSLTSQFKAKDLTVQYGLHKVHNFEMILAKLPEKIVYLGMNLMGSLGLGITGLEQSLAEPSSDSFEDDKMLLSETKEWPEEDLIESSSRQDLLKGLEQVIEDNQAIPLGAFCSHPSARILIDTGEAQPVYRRQYPIPAQLYEKVDEQIKKWLDGKVITEASPGNRWNLPLLCVPKKNDQGQKSYDKVRICLDTRTINALIPEDKYLVPVITTLFKRLEGFAVASAIDLESGYNQFPVFSEHQHKLAFTWKNTQYMFAGCPYGLKHITAQFQRATGLGCPRQL